MDEPTEPIEEKNGETAQEDQVPATAENSESEAGLLIPLVGEPKEQHVPQEELVSKIPGVQSVELDSVKISDTTGNAIKVSSVARVLITVKDKLVEKSPQIILKPKGKLRRSSRRDFLVYGGGVIALSAGFWWLLPNETKAGLGFASSEDPIKRKLLDGALSFDDLVAQSLFSPKGLVPTYAKSQMTEVPNNYAGQTPGEDIVDTWELQVKGLASNRDVSFSSAELLKEFPYHEQITRLVCVEGWSAISGWGGLRFADFIRRYPPRSDCKWIQLRCDVNLDSDGNVDPYFVSFDLQSAMHPQTLLATHHNGKPLELEHGAPLRLLAPMKLGLKNIKAVTSIVYSANEPDDYWNQNGYSYYDGI